MWQAQLALSQIEGARRYTLNLLAGVPEADWFRMPEGGVTHIAWQVGHLATAQYRLVLVRLRGERLDDSGLIAPNCSEFFGRGSVPAPDPARYPSPAELRATLDRVHAAVCAEVPRYSDAQLDEAAPPPPHPLFTTKGGALFWCAMHEMVHAGQIGLLKRLLGRGPQW
ncbi:MAG: DinB family protein [Planctomycetia bacterium]|nr:DinB family protein [Planctomycetia bacterium]